jgi:hypothetical protein
MARRYDTGWRDGMLSVRHFTWGHPFPVAGMEFPMVEYDRGEPLAVISYVRRGQDLPRGSQVSSAYSAFGTLHRKTGEQLPFFTVSYDSRNWAYSVFPHNPSAREFLSRPAGWVHMTELQFVDSLYRLRGRYRPELAAYGVDLATDEWIESEPSPDRAVTESWRHQLMSSRRRGFEPVAQTRPSWRNPCVDIDLAVIDKTGDVALLVDYKSPGAKVNPKTTNMQAMSSLHSYRGTPVAAMLVSYEPTTAPLRAGWVFRVYCLNQSARLHLAYTLGPSDDYETAARAIGGAEWVDLSEQQWRDVLNAARDL